MSIESKVSIWKHWLRGGVRNIPLFVAGVAGIASQAQATVLCFILYMLAAVLMSIIIEGELKDRLAEALKGQK